MLQFLLGLNSKKLIKLCLLYVIVLLLALFERSVLMAHDNKPILDHVAEEDGKIELDFEALQGIISGLIQDERYVELLSILKSLQGQAPDNKDLTFFIGMAAMETGDYDIAIMQFTRLLALSPDSVRVRLELARALYETGQDDMAYRQFRMARSGDLPQQVIDNIDRYLITIRNRKTFTWDFGFSVAPDSNINAAPSVEEISIFGIPFQLSDEAKRTSGFGLMLESKAEYSPSLNDFADLRLGGEIHHTDYSGRDFDDTIINGYIGPRINFNQSDFSPLVAGFYRRYGGQSYNQGYGVRFEWNWHPYERLQLGSSLERLRVDHEFASELDGHRTSAIFFGSYVLTPYSGAHGFFGVTRESASSRMLSNNIYRGGVGYYREMFGGITAMFRPEYLQANYDETIPAFGVKRKDKFWRFTTELTNRRWMFKNVTPTLSLIYSDRNSNIDLYSYSRNQVRIGLRKVF